MSYYFDLLKYFISNKPSLLVNTNNLNLIHEL